MLVQGLKRRRRVAGESGVYLRTRLVGVQLGGLRLAVARLLVAALVG